MTTPTNAIGPVKAVTTPVITAVIIIMMNLIFLTFIPVLVAYFSPSSSEFKGFCSKKTAPIPIIINDASNGILSHETLPRLPKVQVIKSLSESGSAKLCRIVIAALATYPKIIPKTNIVTESFIRTDTARISINTSDAPATAVITCAMLPSVSIIG